MRKINYNPQTGEVLHFRHPFHRNSCKTHIDCKNPTAQEHEPASRVDNIIARYNRTGFIPPSRSQPQYADVSNLNAPLIELANTSQTTISDYKKDVTAFNDKKRKQKAEQPAPPLSPQETPPAPTAD